MIRFAKLPLWALCWLIAVGAAIVCRPPLPVDETRYLAVAWEMWLHGDWLVPHLNGEAYHHKPPLLFWLMAGGWSVLGVNDWWPRLVAPLFALASLWWSGRLAGLLWPEDTRSQALAPLILCGAAFWAIFQTLTMFDMMLAACTLAGICALVRAWRGGGLASWLGLGAAIGVGILAKGPAILLHILPVALLAPWWGPALPGGPDRPLRGWRHWYLNVLLAVLVGAAIALAWAIPAGIRGGEEYRNMIFWGQSAGRIVDSFDHARPMYWYLMLLAPLLLPWLAWPRLWRALRRGVPVGDGAMRLLAAWVLPALVIFSLISGKQLHYLLPEFAAFALLFARALSTGDAEASGHRRFDPVFAGSFFALLGALTLLLPSHATLFPGLLADEPDWFSSLDTHWGVVLLAIAAICFIWCRGGVQRAVGVLALSMALLVATVHVVARDTLTFAYDLRPLAKALKVYEDEGRPLGNFGYYHGQYQFLGRLEKPMAVLGLEQADTDAFVIDHPDGVIVSYYYTAEMPTFPTDAVPLASYQFRNFKVLLWNAALFERYPELGNRS